MSVDNNSLPHLLDLRLRLRSCGGGESDVLVDLRIHRAEIDCPDNSLIAVEIKRATLDLELAGLDAVPRTRIGEPIRELQVIQKQATNIKAVASGKATASAGVDVTKVIPAHLKLSADATVEAKITSTTTSKQETAEYRVKARGGDTWEVSEPKMKTTAGHSEAVLDGTYLDDETLCKVQTQSGANRTSVALTAYVRQRDVALTTAKGAFLHKFVNPSQEKLFNIFVVKSLGITGGKYAGIVKLSCSEIDIEN